METELYHQVKIGDLELSGNLFLAPVAGYTDRAFRSICIDEGANFSYTELISAEALVRGNESSIEMMQAAAGEKNYAVQLFGSNPVSMGQAAKIALEKTSCRCIDINCGCPVPKVVKTGAGSGLIREPEKLYAVAKSIVDAVEGKIPVSVKIRSGWDSAAINWQETSEAAIKAGVAAITLHPRTRAQGYEGKADWSCLAQLVEFVRGVSSAVRVFGSGDLFSPEDARRMLAETKCDAVMFARGAMGNPFIFRQTKSLLQSGSYQDLPPGTKIKTGMKEMQFLIEEKGEIRACLEMRKRFCCYTKGIPGGAAMRADIVHATTRADYEKLFAEYNR